jgi:hypothetical protein
MVRTAGRWPHLLLVAGVVTIALSVLAMHQLAVDHTLAAPANPGWHQADHPPLARGASRMSCRQRWSSPRSTWTQTATAVRPAAALTMT